MTGEGVKIIFLDIDGVLNGHGKLPGSVYCGICLLRAGRFNRILNAVPEAKIVVSSSWRYMIFRGDMTLRGFEMLLQLLGVNCEGRLIGHTCPDGEIEDEPHHGDAEAWRTAGLRMRRQQIMQTVKELKPTSFVVLDDLPLHGTPNLIQTDPKEGLTDIEVDRAIRMLRE